MADAQGSRRCLTIVPPLNQAIVPTSTKDPTRGERVSVVLIVRNGAQFVADALESIHEQTQPPSEVVVIDGHSTDDTVAIARRFPLVDVVPQSGSGIANAYNQGIARAHNDLVAFISHDDRWLKTKLESQLAALGHQPDAELVFTHVQHVLAEGAMPPPGFRASLLDAPVPGYIMETLLARRSVFDRIGTFDPAFAVGEDTDWFARARDANVPTILLAETLVVKRVHATNSSLTHAGVNQLLLKALRQSIARKRSAEQDA